jgi:3-phenylpropionate/cinnamic acid dioxygenase small subunit
MSTAVRAVEGASDLESRLVASELIFEEADALDQRDWQRWLSLYSEHATFWMPAWLDEDEQCSDPDTQVSLIYHESLHEMKERVDRVLSLKSITTMPIPRTVHVIGNVRLLELAKDRMRVGSNASVHVYDPRTADHHIAAVKYRHTLGRQGDGAWRITEKKIALINDRMPSVVDFYAV